MKRTSFFAFLVLMAVLVTSCSFQSSSGDPHAWIDAPLNGSVLPLNSPVAVISHSNDLGGISKVELSINDTVLSTDDVAQADQVYVSMNQAWTPTQPGRYQVRVRALAAGGKWSDYAVVNVTVEGGPTATPTLVVSLTPVISSTPTLTPTPAAPTLTLIKNAFCRKGPDVSFPDVTGITVGETVEIRGVSQDGFWYFIYWPRFKVQCWVAASTGQVNGNLQGIPALVSPNTPTSTEAQPVPEPTGYKP